MKSQPEQLRQRTKHFALRIVKLFQSPPTTDEVRILGRQVLRSGTSVAANYRAVCRARLKAEFIAKMGVTVEEADETLFWLELLVASGIAKDAQLRELLAEAKGLTAIFAVSQRTARANQAKWPNYPIAE